MEAIRFVRFPWTTRAPTRNLTKSVNQPVDRGRRGTRDNKYGQHTPGHDQRLRPTGILSPPWLLPVPPAGRNLERTRKENRTQIERIARIFADFCGLSVHFRSICVTRVLLPKILTGTHSGLWTGHPNRFRLKWSQEMSRLTPFAHAHRASLARKRKVRSGRPLVCRLSSTQMMWRLLALPSSPA